MAMSAGTSYDRVRKALTEKAAGTFKAAKHPGLENDIWVITEKMNKVKQMMPECSGMLGMSDDVQGLLKLVGKKKIIMGPFSGAETTGKKSRKAASLF